MKQRSEITRRLIEIAEPVCADAGYELVDVEYTQGRDGWVVRVYIDRLYTPGAIGLEDCERVSRELGAVLDVEDPVPHKYSLEVSSPGVDRPLRTAEHFRRHLGQVAKITLGAGIEGRKNFKGKLIDLDFEREDAADATIAIDVDGKMYRLPLSDVLKAKLVPDWDALFKESRSAARLGGN